MIDTSFDAKQYSTGMITTALACPVGAPATQRSVGPMGPGGVNCMIAGRGVVHSERFERLRTLGGRLELLQILMQ
ncbi:MAG: hypothetical protein KF718_05825 [Polyangiaceae bacterium]|nr:hypothetical protein [Polyangiaceae bacterium]